MARAHRGTAGVTARTPARGTRAHEPLSRAARALPIALAALWALRALAAWLPGRHLWGVDLARDVEPQAGWLLWGAVALTLLPFVSRPLIALVPARPRGQALLAVAFAALLAGWAWTHPDIVRFTGDSDLRDTALLAQPDPLKFIPQATPGDRWLHVTLPLLLQKHGVPPARTNRAIGALLAALTALAAWRLVHVRRASGAAAFAILGISAATAALALYGGYAKGSVELVTITFAAGVSAFALAEDREGPLPLALLACAGVAMHRAGITLLPVWLAALALEFRRRGAAALARPATWLAIALPIAALAWLGPQLLHTFRAFDAAHHLPGGTGNPRGALAYAFAPLHLADLANLLVLFVPLLPLLIWFVAREPAARTSTERVLLAALLLPWAAILLLVRPQQGLFRDWDMYAAAGTLLATALAVRAGSAIAREKAAAWLAVPLVLMSLVPALQWSALQHDRERGLERARQMLAGPPAREADVRAAGYSEISMRYFGGDWNRFAQACSLSLQAAPNPSVFVQWGMAKTMLEQYAQAQKAYRHAAFLNPNLVLAWRGVAASSSALGDLPSMQLAVDHLRVLDPQGTTTRDAIDYLERARPAHRTQ